MREFKTGNRRVVLSGAPSYCQLIISDVPQGSVLGPAQFIVYMHDLETDILSKVVKFADDTKIGGTVTEIKIARVLSELIMFVDGIDKWQMCFNVDKYKSYGHR